MKKVMIVFLMATLITNLSFADNYFTNKIKPTNNLFLLGRIITGNDLQKQKEVFVRSITRTNNYTDYLPLTAGSGNPLSGTLYSSVTHMFFNFSPASGTDYAQMYVHNTGGDLNFGVESSSGGNFASGASAYATYIGSSASTSLQFGTNSTVRYTIDGSGNNTWTGSGSFSSSLTAGAATFSSSLAATGTNGVGKFINTNTNGVAVFAEIPVSSVSAAVVSGSVAAGSRSWYSFIGQSGDGTSYTTNNFLVYGNGDVQGAASSFTTGTFSGNVGIGTTSPSEKLHVNGNIRAVGNLACQKVTVTQTGWPDYVFNPSFKLKSLLEVEQFIKQYNHLPGVPSGKEIKDNGVDLGATETILLKKIEELTLYMIEMKKEIAILKSENVQIKKQFRTSK